MTDRGAPDLQFVVYHAKPVGQGNLRSSPQSRSYHANAKHLNPWRKAIAQAAHINMAGADPLDGPLILDTTVTLPVLKSDPDRVWPTTRSAADWDHLARAICDALVQGGAMRDDSLIVDGRTRKVYAGQPGALTKPGALIRIWRADHQLLLTEPEPIDARYGVYGRTPTQHTTQAKEA